MTTPRANLDVTNVKEWSFRARSLLAARIAISYLTEFVSTNNRLIIKADVSYSTQVKVEIAKTTAAESRLDLARPVSPNVTYFEILYFFLFSIILVITQAWRDFVERRPFRPTLATDLLVHYYVGFSTCPGLKLDIDPLVHPIRPPRSSNCHVRTLQSIDDQIDPIQCDPAL